MSKHNLSRLIELKNINTASYLSELENLDSADRCMATHSSSFEGDQKQGVRHKPIETGALVASPLVADDSISAS